MPRPAHRTLLGNAPTVRQGGSEGTLEQQRQAPCVLWWLKGKINLQICVKHNSQPVKTAAALTFHATPMCPGLCSTGHLAGTSVNQMRRVRISTQHKRGTRDLDLECQRHLRSFSPLLYIVLQTHNLCYQLWHMHGLLWVTGCFPTSGQTKRRANVKQCQILFIQISQKSHRYL